MRKSLVWGSLAVFSLCLLMVEGYPARLKDRGRVTLIKGLSRLYQGKDYSPKTIKRSLKNFQLWSRLKIRQELKPGDVISVAARSRLDIVFPNEKIRLDGPTLFQIRELGEVEETGRFLYIFKRKTIKKVSKFKLFFGRVMAKVNKLRRRDIHNLETPTAVMGVYGTAYQARSTSSGKGDIRVTEGKVRVAFAERPGLSHLISAGQQLKLITSRDQKVEIKPIPPKVLKKLQKAIKKIQVVPVDISEETGKKVDEEPEEEVTGEDFTEEAATDDNEADGDENGTDEKAPAQPLPPKPVKPPLPGSGQSLPPPDESFFPNLQDVNYFGGGEGSGHGSDQILIPPNIIEKGKIDVKIKLDWSKFK